MSVAVKADHTANQKRDEQYILIPWSREEAMDIKSAASQAGVSPLTMRDYASKLGIGRVVSGRVWISRVALAAHLDGDLIALTEYQRGYRDTPRVVAYFQRLGIPIIEPIQVDS